ncbi:outer membrane protein OmpK [uncultured Halomonas sp.]|uniref:outer membrane protein OmpK n=1 Tax=uncultured Halomonas sp. TaxID=173971 RepID=UPI002609AF29|nr:outer membrane protein OmpK [uncultured Halomonas sp.]
MQKCIPRPHLSAGLLFASLVAGNAQATTWSDTFIGYRYGTQFTEPANPRDVEKHVLQFTHVSGYTLGQNFLNLDVLQSDSADPASGGDSGATEAYLTYRHQLHLGKLTAEPVAFGPVKDVALTGGFDLNTKNTAFAPRKRLLVVGPTLKFNVPKGFADLSLFYAHEWNHCGASFCDVNEIEFDPYYQINLAWGLPFEAGPLPLKFQGFYNYNGEKGEDYQGNDTDPEQLMRTSLMLDVGQLAWGEANQLWAGVGYEYWHNKFGNHGKDGVDTDAPTFQLEWHL